MKKLFADPNSKFGFENRILVVSLLASAIICAAILIVVTTFDFPNHIFALVLGAALASALFFFLALENRIIKWLKPAAVFIFPLISAYIWFYSDGIYGHTPALIMVNSFISLFVYSKFRLEVLLYYTLLFFILLGIQILKPEIVLGYPTTAAKFYSIIVTYSLVGFLSGILMVIIRLNYEEEHKKLLNQQIELEKKQDETKALLNQLQKHVNQKDRLLSIVSHDSRTPINNIESMINLLIDNEISEDEFKIMLPEIRRNIKETSAFMDNLLIWVKSQQEEIKPSEKSSYAYIVIEKVIELYRFTANQKNIKLSFSNSLNEPVKIDGSFLHVIVRNLVQNALKFTPNNGEIRLWLYLQNDQLIISVKDNGIGIKKEKVIDLISSNNQSDDISNGLGLKLVVDFIKMMGGSLDIKSSPGKGSEFIVSLPI